MDLNPGQKIDAVLKMQAPTNIQLLRGLLEWSIITGICGHTGLTF
jgi:hypothetical protein